MTYRLGWGLLGESMKTVKIEIDKEELDILIAGVSVLKRKFETEIETLKDSDFVKEIEEDLDTCLRVQRKLFDAFDRILKGA